MESSYESCHEPLPIKAAVFSSWSHTIGPQMVHMWMPKQHNLPKRSPADVCQTLAGATQCQLKNKTKKGSFEREVEDLTSQLLHGELHNESTPCNRSKVFVLPGKGLVLHSRIFRVNSGDAESGAPLALTIIYDYQELEYMWICYAIIELTISRTISSMKKNCKADVGLIISEAMEKFLFTLTKLRINNGGNVKAVRSVMQNSSSSNEKSLLERLLLSHLQTGGCSLVLADSEAEANKMMQFLIQFLPHNERLLSFGNLPDKKWSYYPGIMIQALIKDKFGQASVWVQHMLLNPCPTTIVDARNDKVRQLMHSTTTSQCTWRHQGEESAAEKQATLPDTPYSHKCSLKSVSQTGRLVPEFLKELYILDQEQRETYSKLFMRHLAIKSAATVRIADHMRRSPCGIQSRDLKAQLGLSDTLDLKVLLGCSQRLHPDPTPWGGK